MKALLRNFAVVAIVLAACGTAHAQTKTWAVTSGDWSASGSWSPSGAPASANTVVIDNGGTATVNTSASGFPSLTISNSSVLRKDNSSNPRTLTMSTSAASGLVTNSGTIRYGQGSGVFAVVSGPAGVNNSGLVTGDVAGQELRLTMTTGSNGVDLVNTGTIQADGGTMAMSASSNFDLINTGGLVRAINGGTLWFRAGGYVNGGTVSVASGATLFSSRANDRTEFTNVTVTNAGRTYTEASAGTTQSLNFLGTTTLTNSGTLEYLSSGTANVNISGTAASTATITNQATGIIRVSNNTTAGTGALHFTNQTASFTNQGGIEILSNAALSTGSSQFRSTAVDFTNAGSFLVSGPVSSIQMGSRQFTQTGGSLSLINGGTMSAFAVNIDGGTLLGTGTITAFTTIGGILSPGNNGIGTFSVTGNVRWNSGNAWQFALGAPAIDLATADATLNADRLALTGEFTKGLGGSGDFEFDFGGTGEEGWYKLVDYGTTTFATGTNPSFQALGLPEGKSANFVVDSTTSALYVQIVPEPSTLALVGLGFGLTGFWACRRRR